MKQIAKNWKEEKKKEERNCETSTRNEDGKKPLWLLVCASKLS